MTNTETTTAPNASFRIGQVVRFSENATTATYGYVTRIWDNGRYLTMATLDGKRRGFVRDSSVVRDAME